MEQYRGQGRGSYIFGRSVHNTRIERLWYDVTSGFGQKWKNFFIKLETHCHLNASDQCHLWLLHFLFKGAINQDASDWVQTWNHHTMQIKGAPNRSPYNMYLLSLATDGARGADALLETGADIGDIAEYGIDWAAADDPRIMNHLLEREPNEWDEVNPFVAPPLSNRPQRAPHVPCDPPEDFLKPWEVQELSVRLYRTLGAERMASRNMEVRRLIWITAFRFCGDIMQRNGYM
ncbi:hypothetical protein C8Q74DRAFT_1315231 [Fomes fomentarius]|nr:hypothetical protein C8Q74DRAFT_1315231 [Fomes fomentarius]